MDDAELQRRFPRLRLIDKPPLLGTFFVFGLDLYGTRDYDSGTNTCVKTRCFHLLGLPLAAVDAYRVVDRNPFGYLFVGREPVSSRARWLNCLVLVLALGLAG
jgi:hypothetical protein